MQHQLDVEPRMQADQRPGVERGRDVEQAQEVGRRGITVNAVAPGFIKTERTENISEKDMKALIPVNRFGSAEEVAHLVAFLVAPESGYITGEVISINGGMYS
jgi:3-oxoacyl-[acyl-carrier protein] reductase